METSGANIEARLQVAACGVLVALTDRAATPCTRRHVVTADGWCIGVAVWPAGSPPPALADEPQAALVTYAAAGLTECQRDILQVLNECAPCRLVTSRVLAELERRGLHHGESTVRVALAHLVREGLLVNANDRRGYTVAAPS